MRAILILFSFFVLNFAEAQSTTSYDVIDNKISEISNNSESKTTYIANYIAKNFTSTDDKLRAAFYWIATNISYDVENMLSQKPQTSEEKIANVLRTKKGVCMHYAELFKDIASKLGIEIILIEGYTKTYGKVAPLSHVWGASKIDGTWYLYDPTWGAGYVENEKYVKKLNNKYYKAEPKSLISSHMPFDYLWQFSEYPITNQEFYDNKFESENKSVPFDFANEINTFQGLSDLDKANASAERIEKNGLKNKLIADRLDFQQKKIDYENQKIKYKNQNDTNTKIQTIVANLNKAHGLLSQFLKYRSAKFTPLVSNEMIKEKIHIPYDIISQRQNDINEINDVPKEDVANLKTLKAVINNSKNNAEVHLNFVNEYLTKDKAEREKMFFIKR
jgi:hypothetical protein